MKHSALFIWHRLHIAAWWCVLSTILSSCEEAVRVPGKIQFEITTGEGSVLASKVPSSLIISVTDGNNRVVEGKQISITTQGSKLVSEAIEMQPGTYKVSRLSVLDGSGKLLYLDEQPSNPDFAVQANKLSTFSKRIGEITGVNQLKSKNANAKALINVFLDNGNIQQDGKFHGRVFLPDDSYLSYGANPEIKYNVDNKGYQSVSCKLVKYFPGYGAYYSWETNFGESYHLVEFYVEYAYIPAPEAVQIVYDGSKEKPYIIDNDDNNSDPDPWAFGTARLVVTKAPDSYQLAISGSNPAIWEFSPSGNSHGWQIVMLNDNGVPFEIKLHYDVTGTFKDINGNINSFTKNGGTIDVTYWNFIDGGPYRNYYNNSADATIASFPNGIVAASITMYADITFDYGMGNKVTYTDTNLGDYYIYKN